MLRIAVCGNGAIAHAVAAVCAARGHLVSLLTDEPTRRSGALQVVLPNGEVMSGALRQVTDRPRRALADADLAMICAAHAEVAGMLRRIRPHVHRGVLIGGIPGFAGFGILARAILPPDVTTFGSQRIPFVVRSHQRGKAVEISGIRRQTFVGTTPNRAARRIAELLGDMLGVPTVPVSHYLNIELSPSNTVVNPARLFALFGPGARAAPRPGLEFFTGWDIASSRVLLALDSELQAARQAMPRDTSFVAPLLLQYDANDARTLTHRFRRLASLSPRPVPLVVRAGRPRLDANSPYLREDIDIGLRTLRDILRLGGASTPVMDEIIGWRRSLPHRPRPAEIADLTTFRSIEALARTLD
jgi:hypothetical protein